MSWSKYVKTVSIKVPSCSVSLGGMSPFFLTESESSILLVGKRHLRSGMLMPRPQLAGAVCRWKNSQGVTSTSLKDMLSGRSFEGAGLLF